MGFQHAVYLHKNNKKLNLNYHFPCKKSSKIAIEELFLDKSHN